MKEKEKGAKIRGDFIQEDFREISKKLKHRNFSAHSTVHVILSHALIPPLPVAT